MMTASPEFSFTLGFFLIVGILATIEYWVKTEKRSAAGMVSLCTGALLCGFAAKRFSELDVIAQQERIAKIAKNEVLKKQYLQCVKKKDDISRECAIEVLRAEEKEN